MTYQNHAVIVLASGLSLRLGQAKQLLTKEDKPLICYMTQLAIETQPQVVVVVIADNDPSIACKMAKLTAQYANIKTIINPAPRAGMAHSLHLGIEALTCLDKAVFDRVLIMGIDQVLLDKPHLLALLAGRQAVVASRYTDWPDVEKTVTTNRSTATKTANKDIIGLPLVIDYELLRRWQVSLTGDKGLRHLIRELMLTNTSQISTVDNHPLSYDIDTPEQLTYARAQGWLDN